MKVTIKQALEATNSLDDYARMEAGVDPVGPRECLITFVSQYDQLRVENERLKVELAEWKATIVALEAENKRLNDSLSQS